MRFNKDFYSATKEYNTFEHNVPAPLFRKAFSVTDTSKKYELTLCGLGTYELFINGKRITKGYFAPYRSNPNHSLYYDNYDLTKYIVEGENVLGVTLGNGMINSNSPVWDFDKFAWRSAPKFALSLEENGEEIITAKDFKWYPSEVLFDDFHFSETIDANKTVNGWNGIGFNDKDFMPVIKAETPKGETLLCTAEPIKEFNTLKPIRILKTESSYVFDFGKSTAGTYTFKVKGEKGKMLKLTFCDSLSNGHAYMEHISCLQNRNKPHPQQQDWLILSGEKDEFKPYFDYKGMRFCEVTGLTPKELKTVDFKFHELSSSFGLAGEFWCDDQTLNAIEQITIQSDKNNFYYFPTDCPQREKNGWTGDAALSSEQFLLNFDCKNSLKIWLKDICKAQNEQGALPGIIPTDTWGFDWGNGPAWDNVLFEIPAQIYKYTGDTEIIEYAKPYMMKYLKYMDSKRDENGLMAYGLDDWCPINTKTPLVNSDSATCKAICDNAVTCFKAIGYKEGEEYAQKLSDEIKKAYQDKLLYEGSTSFCNTQTDQAMAVHYNISKDLTWGAKRLTEYLRKSAGHLDVGVLGNRAFWRVLGDYGYTELAVKVMTQDTFPSFKTWLDQGATTLFENFFEETNRVDSFPVRPEGTNSLNHHFWGDISTFFYKYLAGIRTVDYKTVEFRPEFVSTINNLKAYHVYNGGKYQVEFTKCDVAVYATVTVPKGVSSTAYAPKGYRLVENPKLKNGVNKLTFVKE